MNQDQTSQYWEQRLSSSYSLGGVGYHTVGVNYNRWIYRARKKRFNSIIEKYISSKNISCLDIGSGTGFYIEELTHSGFTNITGSDFTHVAFSGLREKFNQHHIVKLDITNRETLPPNSFQLITCMDVLFHIVDQAAYENAVSNLSELLERNGLLIISENFCPEYKDRGHICDRTKEYILNIHSKNKLKLVGIFPLFIFLNTPVQSKKKWRWRFSNFRVSFLRKMTNTRKEWINDWLGFLLFTIDRMLLNFSLKDKGTSIIVFKKE